MAEENFEEQNMDGVHEENFDEQNVGVVPEENFDEQNLDSVPHENFDGQNVGGENSQPPEAVKKTEHDTKADDIKKWPGWPGENVFRMLIPVQKVGGIIGRKGEFIKRMCQETKARIKILEGPQGATERAVMVSAKEEPDLPIPPAMEGLLRVHKLLIDGDIESSQMLSSSGETIVTRLLLAATQAGSLIGKQGATIKSIQDASHCIVRVLGGETLPPFALPDDSVVEIQGEPAGVHQAVELIATHLRKFLVDRSIIGVFESQMQMSNTRVNQNMPPPPPWGPVGPVPPNFPMNAGGGPGFMPNPHHMPPPRQFDDFYPPPDMAPLDKQPHHGPPAYGKDPSLGPLASNVQTQQSMVMKVTQNMQIPISYADAVIGTSGANISYIRRASGATIAVQETRGVPGEMTVEINGSASQVQTAQQLIQNFIAEAASATQNPSEGGGGPPQGQQGYNAYNPYGPVYASPQPNSAAQPGGAGGGYAPPPPPPGDYASVYGANYGY